MKNILSFVLFILILCLFQGMSFAQLNLKFRDLPATEPYRGTNAPLDFLSHPDANKFRTRLKDAAQEKPNFANHYIVTSWGCGTKCRMIAIIDANNGKIYFPFNVCCWGDDVDDPLAFRLNSTLFVVNGDVDEKGENGVYYFKWERNLMRIISKQSDSKNNETSSPPTTANKPIRFANPAEVSRLSTWQVFTPTEGGFTLSFPSQPGKHETSRTLPNGFTAQRRYYWDTADEQLYLEINLLEFNSQIGFDLEKGIQGFKEVQAKAQGVLLSESKTQSNGIPSVDLLYQLPDKPQPILGYFRIVQCGNKLYTLMAAGTSKQTDLLSNVKKFFDSFKLTTSCSK